MTGNAMTAGGARMIDLNDVDSALHDIKYMADFAAELAGNLDATGAQPGNFQISMSEGNRLAFCCNDILRRIEELLGSFKAK
jgi:hypothetical protein